MSRGSSNGEGDLPTLSSPRIITFGDWGWHFPLETTSKGRLIPTQCYVWLFPSFFVLFIIPCGCYRPRYFLPYITHASVGVKLCLGDHCLNTTLLKDANAMA